MDDCKFIPKKKTRSVRGGMFCQTQKKSEEDKPLQFRRFVDWYPSSPCLYSHKFYQLIQLWWHLLSFIKSREVNPIRSKVYLQRTPHALRSSKQWGQISMAEMKPKSTDTNPMLTGQYDPLCTANNKGSGHYLTEKQIQAIVFVRHCILLILLTTWGCFTSLGWKKTPKIHTSNHLIPPEN